MMKTIKMMIAGHFKGEVHLNAPVTEIDAINKIIIQDYGLQNLLILFLEEEDFSRAVAFLESAKHTVFTLDFSKVKLTWGPGVMMRGPSQGPPSKIIQPQTTLKPVHN